MSPGHSPVLQLNGKLEVQEVVLNGLVVVLHESVCVAQTVAGLGLECHITHLPGDLQSIARGKIAGRGHYGDEGLHMSIIRKSIERVKKLRGEKMEPSRGVNPGPSL